MPGAAQAARALASTTAASSTSSSTATPPAKPRNPSPYRLPTLQTFLGAFAPLHTAGWRLETLPSAQAGGATSHSARDDLLSGADLQGRQLTRAYTFPRDREGWRALTALLGRVGEAVEAQDHHPVITAAPVSDFCPGREIVEAPDAGYVLHIATHTHTPMPPLGGDGVVFDGKPRPGVTGKDLRLAETVEKMYEEAKGGE